ncbi:ankyrin repeat-containing domain protein [Scenedesmus sp. NREL 46B-D3]|nr:ankyrin repeat-containing domain protein [Scenedesmus sp. NREL 46B-D3]
MALLPPAAQAPAAAAAQQQQQWQQLLLPLLLLLPAALQLRLLRQLRSLRPVPAMPWCTSCSARWPAQTATTRRMASRCIFCTPGGWHPRGPELQGGTVDHPRVIRKLQLHVQTEEVIGWSALHYAAAAHKKYAARAGPACRPLVQLLLLRQVDPTSAISSNRHRCSALGGLTPLHLLACGSLDAAVVALRMHGDASSADESGDDATLNAWLCQSAADLQQLAAVDDLLQARSGSSGGGSGGADVNARTQPHGETPLTFAVMASAHSLAQKLLAAGADPNLPRVSDVARPLDLAAACGKAQVACLLIQHGAEVGPRPGHRSMCAMLGVTSADAAPAMLLVSAAGCRDSLHAARLAELLLQRGLRRGLDSEAADLQGETALHAAVSSGDAKFVQLLVDAGANIEATLIPQGHPGEIESRATPLAAAAVRGKLDIMLTLLDAGADPCSCVNEHTGYDMVQAAGNGGRFEAVVKLVEAGASWRLPRGHPRAVWGSIFYVPEILSSQKPGLEVRVEVELVYFYEDNSGERML